MRQIAWKNITQELCNWSNITFQQTLCKIFKTFYPDLGSPCDKNSHAGGTDLQARATVL